MGSALFRLIELPWLVLLNWFNHFWNLGLYIQEVRYFYRGALLKADLLWMLEYGLKNPFEISRRATREQDLDADLTVYGETPWTTLESVCQAVHLTAQDHFVELGCGTGRNLLFLNYRYACQITGYEIVPRFVEKFTWLKQRLGLQRIDLRQANWLDADLQGTVFYLVGSCYSDTHLAQAQQKLADLPGGTRIVTVSYPLTGPSFRLIKSWQSAFSWGKGTLYYQQVQHQQAADLL